ncbi:hypothetical protein [Ferrovibrio sp.]
MQDERTPGALVAAFNVIWHHCHISNAHGITNRDIAISRKKA